MSDNLWPAALRHAVYLRNRAPSAALGGHTPLQMLGAPVDSVNKLSTFGVKVFVKLERDPLLDAFGDEDATVLAAMFDAEL